MSKAKVSADLKVDKTKVVYIRLTKEERDLVKAAAKRAGMSVNEWANQALRQELGGK